MNAKKLYEIMKDVPPTAWPEGLEYGENKEDHGNDTCDFPIWSISVDGVSADILDDKEEWKGEPDDAEDQGEIHSLCPPQNARHMCVGSMLFWLSRRANVTVDENFDHTDVTLRDVVGGEIAKLGGHTLVEALAAACKLAEKW